MVKASVLSLRSVADSNSIVSNIRRYMSHEHSPHPSQLRPHEVFGFTEEEQQRWRISDERLKAIIDDEQTRVHTVGESHNNYGEFLFVTVSRMAAQRRICMSFYGLGFHEYRERWITNEWFWYQASTNALTNEQAVTREEARELIQQRREEITPSVRLDTQSERGRFFEQLADMTDDDAAFTEIEDMGDDLEDWLNGEAG